VNVLHFGEITGLTGVEGKLSSLVVFTVADSRFLPEIAKIQKPGKRVVCLGASPGWPELSYTHCHLSAPQGHKRNIDNGKQLQLESSNGL